MKLNRTGSNWTELERNKINENWDIIEGNHNKLEGEFNDVVGKITDEVVGHLIDSARLDWKEPVDTVEDLPDTAEVGETRMVREADPDGISYVYRYDGEKWEKIQAIDVTLVNEVDRRLSAQLAERATKTSLNDKTSIYWKPNLTEALNVKDYTPDDYYQMVHKNSKYNNHPYFSVETLGRDQSGEYGIFLYKYTPKNFEKTILIVGGTHGSENFTPYFIMTLFQMLLGEDTPSQFDYIKKHVRVLCIPVLNPWGMYRQSKTRYNSRGVDINRNFDWKWADQPDYPPFGYGYKGEAPNSEAETKALLKVLNNYNGISIVFDFHNFGGTAGEEEERNYVIYADTKTYSEMRILTNYLTRNMTNPNVYIGTSQNDASLNNYTSAIYGIPSVNVESLPGRYGPMYSIEDTEIWFELMGNALIVLTKHFSNNDSFFIKNNVKDYGAAGYILENNVDMLLNDATMEIKTSVSGLLMVQGFVAARKTVEDSVLTIKPKLEQPNYLTQIDTLYSPYSRGNSVTIPINAAIPIKPEKEGGIFKLTLKHEGDGTCQIRRFNITAIFMAGISDSQNNDLQNHRYVII